MTAPAPAPRLSPIAGFANALHLLYIRLAAGRIAELQAELAIATAQQQRLKGARP